MSLTHLIYSYEKEEVVMHGLCKYYAINEGQEVISQKADFSYSVPGKNISNTE
jgi:hypothetical protein